jgi:predicted phage baseplate assembly protein
MPLELPVLDDRNYEQLLEDAKRRIPSHTPEWTNFDVESDPGITLVQLFAFLTDNLLYRANRIPERNRLKFLQLLGIPLQPAAAAEGLIAIRNERGPLQALTLKPGVAVTAGSVRFLTRSGLTVLPVEGQVYYKQPVDTASARHADLLRQFDAVRQARLAQAAATGSATPEVDLRFYETMPLKLPTASEPNPLFDLVNDTLDGAVYIALLAPKNVPLDAVREVMANKTLSIGVAPALADDAPPLLPQTRSAQRLPMPSLIYELPDTGVTTALRYARLRVIQEPDVLSQVGVVQLELPSAGSLRTWEFSEPLDEGSGDYPPRLEDEQIRARLLTWIRIKVAAPPTQGVIVSPVMARLSWLGINAVPVRQAVVVANEQLGSGSGEPDQTAKLANAPVIVDSVRLETQNADGTWQRWRLTDDLLAADEDDSVFALDPEAGEIRFGDGLRGARPAAGQRIRASYEYGGGTAGNVAVGAINASPDPRLQGGFKVENPLPTWGGDEGETTEEGERNIPRYLRHRDRLVTAQDFEDVALRTPGVDVGRVEVLPLFHPTRSAANPGVVTLLVVPEYDAVRPRWPQPDRLFLQTVCDHLDPRRLITTEVYVRGPEYLDVYLSVGLRVREGYFRDVVIQDVRTRLEEYLSALPPGGPDAEGWPLSRRVMKKDLEAAVTRVAGVEYVESMQMGVGSGADIEFRDLSGLQLPRLAKLGVREGEAEALAALLGETTPGGPPLEVLPVPVSRTKC